MTTFNHYFIETNGAKLNVIDEGQGEPVLLLHGFPDSNQVWRKQIPALVEAGYRVIAPDLRGFGESEMGDTNDAEAYAIPNLANDVVGLLDALNISKVHLVGHDMGAALGWAVTLLHPERILHYTCLSVGHPYAYQKLGGIEQKIKGWYTFVFQYDGLAERIFSMANFQVLRLMTSNHPELDSHWIPDFARPGRLKAAFNWYRAVFAWRKHNNLAALRAQVPVLAVWSEDDVALTRKQMVNSSRFCDHNFKYIEIPKVGHWMPVDAPEIINEILLNRIAEYGGELDVSSSRNKAEAVTR